MFRAPRCRAHRRDRAVSVVAAVLVGICGLAAMLVGPAAQAGPDRTDPGPVYPAGAAVTLYQGEAFDTCSAPPARTMDAWRASPYRAVGIYISGPNRGCKQPELTADWVARVTALGWHLLPIDLGLQAPCRDNVRKKPMDRDRARSQGASEAAHSVSAADALGILPGSAIYADIESYRTDSDDCSRTVADYLSGWTNELHRRGYLAGMYGNLTSGVNDAAQRYASAGYTRPDAVWQARWDGSPALTRWQGVDDTRWPGHQRAKQYRGDHVEKHGGVSMNIDSNALDTPVATVAAPFAVTGRHVLAHRAPSASSPRTGSLSAGRTARAVCQSRSDGGRLWDELAGGGWVLDTELAGGAIKALPRCAYPASVTAPAGAVTRSGPGVTNRAGSAIPLGALAWVGCHEPERGQWLRLPDHSWVASGDLSFGERITNALPACDDLPAAPVILGHRLGGGPAPR